MYVCVYVCMCTDMYLHIHVHLFMSFCVIVAAVAGMLIVGCLYNQTSSWVLALARDLGYQFEADQERQVVMLVREVLDHRQCQLPMPPDTTPPTDVAMTLLPHALVTWTVAMAAWTLTCRFE